MVCSHLLLLFSQSCPTVWHFMTAAGQALLSITTSWNLLKLMSFESMMPSTHHILSHSLFLLSSIFPSIRLFSNEFHLHQEALPIRWPKYWSFSFSISPSNEYSELISFRINWFDLLAVHRTLKSLLPALSSGINYPLLSSFVIYHYRAFIEFSQ